MTMLVLVINGQAAEVSPLRTQPLVRAVLISLFTWRRANDDDDVPGPDRQGWWADAYAPVQGDRIGSRLWLLGRSTLSNRTPAQAEVYVREALQWLVDDGVGQAIEVTARRVGVDRLDLSMTITRGEGEPLALRFDNVWEFLRGL